MLLGLPLFSASCLLVGAFDHWSKTTRDRPTSARVGIEIIQLERAEYPEREVSPSVESGNWRHSLARISIFVEAVG